MKTTTILSIVAIVAAVAAAGLVTAVSLSTPAHATACNSHIFSPGKPQSACSNSLTGKNNNIIEHIH
jgi:hypothetical protein